MAFSVLILRNPIPCLVVALTVLVFAAFLGYGYFLPTLFTICFVISSSIFLNFSKYQTVLQQAPLEEEEYEYLSQTKMELLSENESTGHSSITDHDSEIDWPYSINQDCSDDGSISDEESLIEIALPSGHFVNYENFSDLKNFSGDMNYEEDNLIEIDLSIGSIKCSRYQIKA